MNNLKKPCLRYLLLILVIPIMWVESCDSKSEEVQGNEDSPSNKDWVQLENFPGTPRTGSFHFSLNNDGFVGLGFDTFGNPLNDCWKYNIVEKKWVKLSDFAGVSRGDVVSFFIDDFLYVGLGATFPAGSNVGLKDFWKYNPKTDEWFKLKDFPEKHLAVGFNITVNNEGYLFGGLVNGNSFVKSVWNYKPLKDEWVKKNDMPIGRYGRGFGAGFMLDGLIYFGLGTDAYQNYNDLWKYDFLSDSWEQIDNFSGEARVGALSFSHKGEGYILMGRNSDAKTSFNEVWKYDKYDEWVQLMMHPDGYISGSAHFVINDALYAVSGSVEGKKSNDFWKLNLN